MNWLFRKTTELSCEEYESIYQKLSASRKSHIDRMKKQDDKLRSLLATAIIDELLASENIVGANLEVDSKNKPYLNNCQLYVSISHSEEGVACAVSTENVGIDIEKIKPVKTALINYVCTSDEKEYVFSNSKQTDQTLITEKETLIRFFKVWTAKEAYFKRHGKDNLLSVNTVKLSRKDFLIDEYLITIL